MDDRATICLLEPGAAHPFPPLDATALAHFLHVRLSAVRRWLEMGLQADHDGRIDPFAAVNWLSAGHLDECPVMARRWRRYVGWFAPFVAGNDRARLVRWQRCHRLYLPGPVDEVAWYLPDPSTNDTQRRLSEVVVHAGNMASSSCRGGVVLRGCPTDTTVTAHGSVDLDIRPSGVLSPGDAEFTELSTVLIDVVASFAYAYRHHRPFEYSHSSNADRVRPRVSGSCIDCAFALGAALSERSRPWRLCAGLVAHSSIANPHVWIEAETLNGWAPLDPTIPAIVRMLGPDFGDWHEYALRYTGGCDARRVTISSGGEATAIPGGLTLDGVGGEAAVRSVGSWANAFPCQDWVCGECDAGFELLNT